MEGESNPAQPMCRSGCGFYGNPSQNGLCSVCYKNSFKIKRQPLSASISQQQTQSFNPPVLKPPKVTRLQQPHIKEIRDNKLIPEQSGTGEEAGTSNTNDPDGPDGHKDSIKGKRRCGVCRKKLGLIGFDCRCTGLFCGLHKYSDTHNCTFDYRAHGAQAIRRNNPTVAGEKIPKIWTQVPSQFFFQQ